MFKPFLYLITSVIAVAAYPAMAQVNHSDSQIIAQAFLKVKVLKVLKCKAKG